MIYTITEAAKELGVSRQAVYVALFKVKKLEGYKIGHRWKIHKNALEEYKKNKYKRISPPGLYSIDEASKKLSVSYNRIYYLMRTHKIVSIRHNNHDFFHEKELNEKKSLIKSVKKIKKKRNRALWKINQNDIHQKVG